VAPVAPDTPVDHDVVVPLVVRNFPLLVAWVGTAAAMRPAAVLVPEPPLAIATTPVTLAAFPVMLPEMSVPGMEAVQEALVALVVRKSPLFPAWLGSKALMAAGAVAAPVPPAVIGMMGVAETALVPAPSR
jgi:hypothetical protein